MEGRGSTAEPGRAELTYGDYEEGTRRMRQEEVFGKLSNWRLDKNALNNLVKVHHQMRGMACKTSPSSRVSRGAPTYVFSQIFKGETTGGISTSKGRELYSNTYVPTYSDDVTAEIEIPTL
ncbi:hypothetical protein IWW34DRAFT_792369 [Fusarium oxysporum f. sp. albedinis]|nr:hypothetical protein IWW34DRAFT_792369 [Fusarium oxysporum f. sp. albedinis]